jgi:hypothetical protein
MTSLSGAMGLGNCEKEAPRIEFLEEWDVDLL